MKREGPYTPILSKKAAIRRKSQTELNVRKFSLLSSLPLKIKFFNCINCENVVFQFFHKKGSCTTQYRPRDTIFLTSN